MKKKIEKRKTKEEGSTALPRSTAYTGDYLEPEQVYALRKLILLGKDQDKSRKSDVHIASLIPFWSCDVSESIRSFAAIADIVTGSVTEFLDSLAKNGVLQFVDPLRRAEDPGQEGKWSTIKALVRDNSACGAEDRWPNDDRFKIRIVFHQESTTLLRCLLDEYLEVFLRNRLRDLPAPYILPYSWSCQDGCSFFLAMFRQIYGIERDTKIVIGAKTLNNARAEWESRAKSGMQEPCFKALTDMTELRPVETLLCMEKEDYLDVLEMLPDRIVVNLKDSAIPTTTVTVPESRNPIVRNDHVEREHVRGEPKYLEKDGWGFVSIGGREIKIGKVSTRKCNLMRIFSESGEKALSMEVVISAIQLKKDENNSALFGDPIPGVRKRLIETTVKEINREIARHGVGPRFHWAFLKNDHAVKFSLS